MTVPIWPSDLPQQVLVSGFTASARGNRLVTAPDSGPPKQRRRGPLLRPVQASIFVNQDERSRFDRFFDEEVIGGTQPFLIPDQNTDGLDLFSDTFGQQLQDENGVPLLIESWWLVQFGQSQPSVVAASGFLYTIQFDLIVLP
ncbi:hypothetical protein ACWX0K_14940 [Nitrobacteraceae bacterium UC4446_H13]